MPKWNDFSPSEIEYDFEIDKLHVHRVTFEEAYQCFFNRYLIKSNKKFKDRFKLLGITDAGRTLCIIFQLKQNNSVRIITGWEE